jgi:hypothetical protein
MRLSEAVPRLRTQEQRVRDGLQARSPALSDPLAGWSIPGTGVGAAGGAVSQLLLPVAIEVCGHLSHLPPDGGADAAAPGDDRGRAAR